MKGATGCERTEWHSKCTTKQTRAIPTESYKSIAIPARKRDSYEELIQIIEAQMLDPLTGMARGEKAPGLSGLDASDEEDETENKLKEDYTPSA